jgi:membrane peptidoglycan carboxypeptidase
VWDAAGPWLFFGYNRRMSAAQSIASLIHKRHKRRHQASHNPSTHWAWGVAVCFSLAAVAATLAAAWGYLSLVRDLPPLQQLPLLVDGNAGQLRQPTRLLDRTGQQVILTLQDPAATGNAYLLLEALPPAIITATLHSDPGFWQHPGYRLGAETPTLAERLVTDLLLWNEPDTSRRAWRASLLAGQATARYGRKKILEWTLNSAPYGPGVYGIEAAARAYLGKSATALTLAEATFLTAASASPAIHPVRAAELTRQRQTEILLDLSTQGQISPSESLQASQATLPLQPPTEIISAAPAFTSLALQQLDAQIPLQRLERGGLRITTSLDLDLQTQAACTIQAQLARLNGQAAPACEAARLLPTLSSGAPITTSLAANAAILDPATGQVLALVGPNDPHPGGSLLTPLLYLSAFAGGQAPASLAWDIPGETGISNFDGQFHGPVRLRTALANDYLVPAAQLYQQVGAANLWQTLASFGLTAPTTGDDFTAFTDHPLRLLEATHALGVLANQGTLAGISPAGSSQLQPVMVLTVESVDGRPWLDWREGQRRPLVGAQLAYLLTHILSDEPARWPALGHPNPLEIGRPAAVKLSQTPAGADTWAVGAIPQRIVGVWVGKTDTPTEATRLSPLHAAAIWHALTQYAGRSLPFEAWPTPPGVTSLAACDPSGLLPTLECPNVVNEVFIAGNEPTRLDDLYRSVPVNRISGLLATIFTPPALVEERVYLNIPAQAIPWAQQAGLPIPPTTYDIINLPPANPRANFTTPHPFDHVRGQVTLTGTASSENFASYRLLVGAGLNPQRWLLIGDEASQPVENGALGQWDASGLSGLYAIQLQVIGDDAQIETAIVQVTVDNQPPVVQLPTAPLTFTPNAEGYIFLQTNASDDLALARLEFWVDESLVGALHPQFGETGPFTLAWQAAPGSHRLEVIAFDRAGNRNQATTPFQTQP